MKRSKNAWAIVDKENKVCYYTQTQQFLIFTTREQARRVLRTFWTLKVQELLKCA